MLGLSGSRPYSTQIISHGNTSAEARQDETEAAFSDICPEMVDTIIRHLPAHDVAAFAQSALMHQRLCEALPVQCKLKVDSPKVIALRAEKMKWEDIFQKYPDCRLDAYVPCDEIGRAYLRCAGIGGPKTSRMIARG